ncbi:MAG: NAD-dependent epimerase/dehydratase family protein [Marinomonas sp.]
MKYLVTGGCGFIGSHLCDALIELGHEVTVLDNLSTGFRKNLSAKAELIIADVSEHDVVMNAMQDKDGCFHLAAVASVEQSHIDWSGTHCINQTGSINVFDAARANKVRGAVPVVYASSAAVYGDNATLPLSEKATPTPISAYGADKLGSELHARVAWLNHSVPTIGMRFFNVYGPRQNPKSPYSGVISIFIDKILARQAVTIYGNGSQTRDFVYVGDVVRHLVRSMSRATENAEIFNVCTGHSTSILQLAKTLFAVSGVPPQIDFRAARSGDIFTSLGHPKKAQVGLNIEAKVELGKGLKMTVSALAIEQREKQASEKQTMCQKKAS